MKGNMDVSVRQSFVIYKSFYEPIKHLNDEELGKLFRVIFEYNIANDNGEKTNGVDVSLDIKMAFEFFKNQFLLDEVKYAKRVEASRTNGSQGGRPTNKPSKPSKPTGLSSNLENLEEPRKPDKDKVKDKGKDKDKEKDFKTNIAGGYSVEYEKWWSAWLSKKWRGTGGVKSNAHKHYKVQCTKLSTEQIQTAMEKYMAACSKANSYHKDAEGFLNPANGLVQQFLDYKAPRPAVEVDRSVPIETSFKNQRHQVRSTLATITKEHTAEYWQELPESWKEDAKIQLMFKEKNLT
tara:strand:- start:119 stop:997 length:879 start_codon:yes stop_codon:yes gene_type:complete